MNRRTFVHRHRISHRIVFVALACAAVVARADLAPSTPNVDKPDFALTSVVLKGKSTTTQNFPITTGAASPATMRLGSAAPVGMQGAACQYELTFDAVNAGPGLYYASNPYDGVIVGVEVKFPDGSPPQKYEGKWFCKDAFEQGFDQNAEEWKNAQMMSAAAPLSSYALPPGVGCAVSEPVVLAVGKTHIAWTFDPGSAVPEFAEGNNKFSVDLVVPPKCEPVLVSVKPNTGAMGPMTMPDGAVQTAEPTLSLEALQAASSSSRESMSKLFSFSGNGRVIKRPVPKSSARSRKP
jgi:hypothetical protein